MTEPARYYWFKMSNNFFCDKRIKRLYKKGGAVSVIIYQKMMLESISTGGIIEFEELEDDFYEQLALDLDEDEEAVKNALETITKLGLIETEDGSTYFLPQVLECTGTETAAAERMRKKRTKSEQERNSSVTDLNNVQKCYTEKEKEKEIEIETETEIYSEKEEENAAGAASHRLSLNNGEYFSVSHSDVKRWEELYPNVNVQQELRSMAGWLEANPESRKTESDMPRFINAWLTRKQESSKLPPKAAVTGNENQHSSSGIGRSYDLDRVQQKINTTVPKLAPKKKKSPS